MRYLGYLGGENTRPPIGLPYHSEIPETSGTLSPHFDQLLVHYQLMEITTTGVTYALLQGLAGIYVTMDFLVSLLNSPLIEAEVELQNELPNHHRPVSPRRIRSLYTQRPSTSHLQWQLDVHVPNHRNECYSSECVPYHIPPYPC